MILALKAHITQDDIKEAITKRAEAFEAESHMPYDSLSAIYYLSGLCPQAHIGDVSDALDELIEAGIIKR